MYQIVPDFDFLNIQSQISVIYYSCHHDKVAFLFSGVSIHRYDFCFSFYVCGGVGEAFPHVVVVAFVVALQFVKSENFL